MKNINYTMTLIKKIAAKIFFFGYCNMLSIKYYFFYAESLVDGTVYRHGRKKRRRTL
jgi:hypothetical protein